REEPDRGRAQQTSNLPYIGGWRPRCPGFARTRRLHAVLRVPPRLRYPSSLTRSRFALGAHAEARSLFLTRRRGERGVGAGPGCVLRKSERAPPGSTFKMNVVSAGGIHAHPAGERAGRGRLRAANPDPPGTNHHITRSLSTPRSL